MATSKPTTSSSSESCLFVKVHKEGCLVGRKVDLYQFSDYQSLEAALSDMFNTPIGYGDHTLMYIDEGGNWKMAGDDSWDHFLSTVKKLRIMKSIGSLNLQDD